MSLRVDVSSPGNEAMGADFEPPVFTDQGGNILDVVAVPEPGSAAGMFVCMLGTYSVRRLGVRRQGHFMT
jgi:hypothetical protein